MPYRPKEPEPYRDGEWLREQYIENRRSTQDIADELDCTRETIRRWLHRHDIGVRGASEAAKIRMETHPELAERMKEKGAENLRDVTPQEIWTEEEFEEFRQWMSETRKGEGNPMYGVTGRDNPRWVEDKPNRQFYQSNAWREVRAKALEQANGKCEVCGSTEQLVGHHVVPLSDGGAKLDVDNVSILCRSCHGRWEGLYLRPDVR